MRTDADWGWEQREDVTIAWYKTQSPTCTPAMWTWALRTVLGIVQSLSREQIAWSYTYDANQNELVFTGDPCKEKERQQACLDQQLRKKVEHLERKENLAHARRVLDECGVKEP